MARAIEQLKQAMEACELGALTLPDQVDALMDAGKAILQEVSTLTPPNEWVSVYDRLPEPGERVLATDCGFVGEFYINKRGKWQRYNVNCSELLMALDILYWMPLPEPPDLCPPDGEEDT